MAGRVLLSPNIGAGGLRCSAGWVPPLPMGSAMGSVRDAALPTWLEG
ncbi:hypothetical protein [Candidatus Symbiobacter mobilis]|nr:hypothetical protein [Candidatus Symbiobacter mobilis]